MEAKRIMSMASLFRMVAILFVLFCGAGSEPQRRQSSILVGQDRAAQVTSAPRGDVRGDRRGGGGPSAGEMVGGERAQRITFGAILPTTALITVRRAYYKRISDSVENLMRGRQN